MADRPYQGYWEPHTSDVDWCEDNYVYSYYVAEWWNTMSSLVIVAAGMWGMYKWYQYRYHKRLLLSSIIIFITGIGSALFHATLNWQGQAFDELPMIYGTLIFSYPLWEIEARSGESLRWLMPTMIIYAICFTLSYLFFPQFFWIFIVIYVASVTALLYQSYLLSTELGVPRITRVISGMAFTIYTFIFLFVWIPEQLFCDQIRFLHTHAIWHVGSAVGTYLFIVFATYETIRRQNIDNSSMVSIEFNHIGFLPVPYVHLSSVKSE